MNRCPITYEEIQDGLYSAAGLKKISNRLLELHPLDYTAEELLEESIARSGKISVEGVQPKLSAILSVRDSAFKLVDQKALYIIKPQQPVYTHVPENEDLTMRLAEAAGIEVPLHGLLYDKGGEFHYFIRRFDRTQSRKKIAVEDFAQLSGKNRNTKYDSSMEKVVSILDQYCTFPVLEKVKLFKLTLFNYLTGNEDMHLKNFSLITQNGVVKLTPAYDLVNTTIILKNAQEEIALPLRGKKRNLTKSDLINYYGKERLGLHENALISVITELAQAVPEWIELIAISFLSDEAKKAYTLLLQSRFSVLFD
jgi:serine/threonine-protein kinase HipA